MRAPHGGCDGTCVATTTDPNNCGGCGIYGVAAVVLPSGDLALLGGEEEFIIPGDVPGSNCFSPNVTTYVAHAEVQIFDAATLTWNAGAPLLAGHGQATATVLDNGHVLVAGGVAGQCPEINCPVDNGEFILPHVESYQ